MKKIFECIDDEVHNDKITIWYTVQDGYFGEYPICDPLTINAARIACLIWESCFIEKANMYTIDLIYVKPMYTKH